MLEPILFSSSPVGPRPGGSRRDDDDLGVLAGRRVLLAEDEVFIAFDLRHAFEEVGAEVLYARTLSHALALVAERDFDAAVLDVTLGGADTCKPIAGALEERGIPFVIHSGDLDRQGEVIAQIDAVTIPKPAEPEQVVRELAKVVIAADRTKH